MSRIGKQPITIPAGVTVDIADNLITVKGAKGTLIQKMLPQVGIEISEGVASVVRKEESREARAAHGLYRTLLANMVQGVSKGWTRELEIVGTGYRAAMQGTNLQLSLGFSHQVIMKPYDGITFTVTGNKVTVSGFDKQLVGQMAAEIRAKRKPDAYKGKGVRYSGEVMRLKAGKAKKAK